MHLNKEFRHPDVGDLFALTDVTAELIAYLPEVAEEIERQQQMLEGPIPEIAIGEHCFKPRDCPFMARCWPNQRDHIINLVGVGPKRSARYFERGIQSIADLPANERLNFAQQRQLKAIAQNKIVVEPTLRAAMEAFTGRLGFLDFETVSRGIPPWRGMGPWHQAAAQFSYHERQPDGSYTHAEHLAEGPLDSRPPLAEAMIRATARADRVVMYTPFERTQIKDLQNAVPHLAGELEALKAKLLDLAPVIRNCVYHPEFRGSFSLKDILNPLCPDLSYNDLVIVDGRVASVEIARLLFVADKIPAQERDRVRQDLLDYCERDTWATVRLVQELRKLAGLEP
jgi:predicted RecB family nuclease